MTTINFTKRELDGLPLPRAGERPCYYDEYQHNLMLRVSHTGQKTFYVRRKVNGISERVQLGRYPEMTIELARKKAAAVLSEISEGRHPKQAARAVQAEPTIGELFENYLKGYARQHCVRTPDMEMDFERYLRDWRHRPYSQIKRLDVLNRVKKVAQLNGPGACNHMIVLMRAVMNWNLRNEIITGDNPWATVKQMRIEARERFLTPEELVRFFKALEEMSGQTIHDYVLISLYTGARRANVLAMRWEQVDFNLRIWRIPSSSFKTKISHVVPLTSNALQLLRERRERVTGEWVFPGRYEEQHLVCPQKAWGNLLRKAQIEDLRVHDLRRTLASYMAMNNQSLQIIAKALGHKTIAATQIYARLMSDPVREAMEKAQADMHLAIGMNRIDLTTADNQEADSVNG